MKRTATAALAAALVLTGCDTLRDAMSAHVDVVAEAGDQELGITRLATLMGRSQAPLNKDVAQAIADAWVNYHLLAEAAVNHDSLTDEKQVDEAMWSILSNIKARKWYEQVSRSWLPPDSTKAEEDYNSGRLLAASHILLTTPDSSPAARAEVRRRAEALRAQVTSANFADMARRNSQDPGSGQNGGSLGIFPRGAMVPQFDQAAAALRPGEISPVVETQFGYHIIRRPTFAEIRRDYVAAMQQAGIQAAESTYLARLESAARVEVKAGTEATIRSVVDYPAGHAKDRTVLATSTLGRFTASDLARWVETFPPQAQVAERVKSAPDSVLPTFVKNFVRNELVIHAADSAKVGPDTAQIADVRRMFSSAVLQAWRDLNLDPKSLDSAASSKSERARIAAQRVETYVDRLLAQQAPYVDVTQPVQAVLRQRYDHSVNIRTLDQVLLEAAKVRLATDSTTRAGQPQSVVPVPNQDTTRR